MKYRLSVYKEMKIIQPTIFFEIRKHNLISKELFKPEMRVLQLSATSVLWALRLTEPSHGTWTIQLQAWDKFCLCVHAHMYSCTHTHVYLPVYLLFIYLFLYLTLSVILSVPEKNNAEFWFWNKLFPKTSAQDINVHILLEDSHVSFQVLIFILKREWKNQWPHSLPFLPALLSRTWTVLHWWCGQFWVSLVVQSHAWSCLWRARYWTCK